MKTVEITDAAASLVKYARRAEKQPIVLTLDGEPVAALVGVENVDMETLAMSNNAKFLEIIQKSRARYKKDGGLSPDELRARLKRRSKAKK
ncbi:MAG: type II toxin-antitoxin system Phd/YefM family antitoxin [Pirellulales bacterium]